MGMTNLSTWAEIAFEKMEGFSLTVFLTALVIFCMEKMEKTMVGFGKGLDCLFDQNTAKST